MPRLIESVIFRGFRKTMSQQTMDIQKLSNSQIICTRQMHIGKVIARYSTQMDDVSWDDYLRGNSQGLYEQSSMWALAKSANGFRAVRVVLQSDDKNLGGVQLLWKRSRLGSWGFINKGPVLSYKDPVLEDFVIDCICRLAKILKLRALIIQPIETSETLHKALKNKKFLPNYFNNLVTATLIVDVSRGMEIVEKGLKRQTRQKVRQAKQRGVIIREGGQGDIPKFFQLMLSTCKRQKTTPNPPNEGCLRCMWNALHPHKSIRLSFAEYKGETLSGLVSILFGNRATFIKRGWSEKGRDLRPNELLMYDALEWSCKNGFKICDFGSLGPDIARTILAGEPLSENQKKSRHFFHLGFGGKPVLYSEGFVYASNSLFRALYRLAFSFPYVSKFVRRLLLT